MSACLDDNTALALIDGKLPPPRRAEVESHLESCGMCRELVAALARDDHPTDSQIGLETHGSDGAPSLTVHAAAVVLRKADSYKIEREVGSGSAGTVFRAVDERSGEVVALKYVTDPAWRSRFRREVETLSRLVHPGIVRYISHGETRQGLYLVMEWLDGEDLAQQIQRGPIPWPGVRALGLRVLAALAHAHSLDAVHRDIGPRNVFLPAGRLEQAKLLDFGLVRVPDALDRTGSQAVLGTPQYMAPEQVRDPRNVDARSDIFSLGAVLFEALSGVRPFDASDLFTLWNKIVGHPPPNLRELAPTVPEGFVTLIERMLAKDPAERPPNAAAVHEALVRLDVPANDKMSTAVRPPMAVLVAQGVASAGTPLAAAIRSTAPMNPVKETVGKATAPMNPIPKESKELVGKATAPIPRNLPPPASNSSRSGPPLIAPPTPSTPSAAPKSGPPSSLSASRSSMVSAAALAPPPLTSSRSERGSSIIIAAALIAGAILIGALGIIFGPRLLDRAGKSEVSPKSDESATPKGPARTETKVEGSGPAPAPAPPPVPTEPAAANGSEEFFCGDDAVERRRGGTYLPDKDFPMHAAVSVLAGCKATLEDCVIGGARSIILMGSGELTLKNCRVLGTAELNGDVTLILEKTTLPSRPKVNGKSRIIQR